MATHALLLAEPPIGGQTPDVDSGRKSDSPTVPHARDRQKQNGLGCDVRPQCLPPLPESPLTKASLGVHPRGPLSDTIPGVPLSPLSPMI